MSNIIIPAEHQSSPRETDIEREVRIATQEIAEGKYTPELPKETDAFGRTHDDDFWMTGTEVLAAHPRVQEALAKLEQQVSDKTNNEYLEKAEMLHEMNAQSRAGFKWAGQTRWQGKENEEMRLVNIMSPKQFIEKLQAAGISAAIEPTISTELDWDPDTLELRMREVERSDALICLGRKVVRGIVGLYAWVDGKYTYVNKLQVPCGPEWTLMRFDEYDVPTNERYHGWRTAVLALIQRRVITEEQAERAFGKVVENAASSFYREQLQQFRATQFGVSA